MIPARLALMDLCAHRKDHAPRKERDMEVHIGKLDHGLTLTIPEAFAAELGLEPNSLVDIALRSSTIIISQARQPRAQLDDLLARVTENNLHNEIETGGAVGRKV